VVWHPAEGEGDSDGGEQARDAASTCEHVGSTPTANYAAQRPRTCCCATVHQTAHVNPPRSLTSTHCAT